MSYQEFDVLPAFELAVFQNGGRIPSISGNPTWSHADPPPDIEVIVDVRINRIGLARVIGYFVESGYLGLLVKPFDPPAWYTDQNGYNATGHVFGAEIQTGEFSAPELKGPNPEQLAALQRFATANGRSWKSALSNAWTTGADEQEPDAHLLRQVRNQFGPKWLRSRRNLVIPTKAKSGSPVRHR